MILHNIAQNTKLHSDQVRAALGAIPTWIALDLPQHDLEALVVSIVKHAQTVYDQGYIQEQKK